MTTSARDLISAAAVEAFTDGEANCGGVLDGRLTANAHDSRCCARAGLAAALPHLADACDALRAAERSSVSTPTPKPITAASGDLSGPHGVSQRNPNPAGVDSAPAAAGFTAHDVVYHPGRHCTPNVIGQCTDRHRHPPAASPDHPDAATPKETYPMTENDHVVEYAILMSGGSMQVRPDDPETERIYPLRHWIANHTRHGGVVYRRVVVVVEDWHEITAGDAPADTTQED